MQTQTNSVAPKKTTAEELEQAPAGKDQETEKAYQEAEERSYPPNKARDNLAGPDKNDRPEETERF